MATLTTSWQKIDETYLGSSGGSVYVRLYAKYSSQDKVNNKSYVYYQNRVYYGGNSYILDAQSSGNVSGTGLSTKTGSRSSNYPAGETVLCTTEGWVSHNSDGKKSVSASAYLNFPNWGWSGTASGSANLPDIPREAKLLTAPSFTDEDNPTITYSNAAGNAVSALEISIHDVRGNIPIIEYRSVNKTGNLSYTFNFTDEERKSLQNFCSGKKVNVRYYLKTTIGGKNFYSYLERELSIINANPLFNNFEWETTNYQELTGNNTTVIKNYSSIKTIVSEENKATALKEATLTSYQTTIGSKSVTNNNIAYPVENVIRKVDGASITVFANDSRGNSTPIIKPISNYIEYKKIIGSISNLERTQQVNSEVNLQVEGEIDLVNFGAIVNSVVSVKYYYKEASSNDDFVEGTTKLNATLTQIEGTKYKYEIDQNIAGNLGANGFDINKSFLIKIVINDELDFAEDTETLGTGSPAIAVKGNCVSLGAPYNEILGGRVQINGVVYNGNLDTYSTEETIIGKWHDGKPIYRKIYYYDSITFTTGEHELNIDLPNLDSVTGFKYSMWYPALSRWYVNWDTIDAHNTTITSNVCKLGSGGENTTFTRATFVFEYTKTTD